MSFDWSIYDHRMFSSSRPIKCQYTFAPVYVHNTTKMAMHPVCISHSNQLHFIENANVNKTVNVTNF